MARRKKNTFRNQKMLSSRVELDDYFKFEAVVKKSGKKSLQQILNLFVTEMISGNLYLSGSGFVTGESNE